MLLCSLVGAFLSNVVVVPASLTLGLLFGDTMPTPVGWTLLGLGMLLFPLSGGAWRLANMLTRDLSVNGLLYFVPVLSLAWLWLRTL